ncbi:NADPH-dependent ferric siderophore reductase, contains FAD-binding and SIP domains [Corynebacterium coyleae]|uniref:Siderophore-interacting protein n=1 Tax=Corynebacterium coyleae TaxID=53374 RepID=A0ABX8KWH8_9CORY|nr:MULTISPECIES: siderophore-interacting protein [Corynebacterium]MDK8799554.1 siderophore-interacting protein [Corynebacterium coyleae]OFL17394.1 NADPH-dependent ferric siderophore reductase [Corynebacterium sp. HMSC067D03]OFU54964.1 NADPH-dependent ferric siderophore reductase [Corynebacterium sp. HMSC11D10]OHO31590.1 NADPH-dependent ferric siderophore reductase [Corynebacterium sp. HMSC034B08]OHQ55771.1 NADPH-dependent ferric siderophore reductase [Corynebacterium sp. HMSC070H05]
MTEQANKAAARRKPRKANEATVTGRRQLSPDLVRLSLNAPAFVGKDLEFTDHYLKLLFVPEGADYSWPFNVEQVREQQPRDKQPVTRTYTLINLDSSTGDFDVDFVTHGDAGLAGPWARVAEVGEKIGFFGPGGAWGPSVDYEHFIFAGDESAAPAIGAGLKRLPEGATATAYIEIEAEDRKFELPARDGVDIHWVIRNGATHGTELSRVVRQAGVPDGKNTSWFIHGVAEMIKEMRRFLFVESEVPKQDVSISGYWRIGMTEDQWQASKRDFNAEIEAEEERAKA